MPFPEFNSEKSDFIYIFYEIIKYAFIIINALIIMKCALNTNDCYYCQTLVINMKLCI